MRRRRVDPFSLVLFLVGACVVAGGLLLAAPSHASPPDKIAEPTNYARAGSPIWAYRRVLTSNAATYVASVSTSTYTPACFGWGTRVQVAATTGAITFCFTLTTTVSLGDQATSSGVLLDDQNYYGTAVDGNIGCVRVAAGTVADLFPRYSYLVKSTTPGYRSGICSGTQSPVIDDFAVAPFCDNASDCQDAGTRSSGSTCTKTTTGPQFDRKRNLGCAFLSMKSPTNSAIADVAIIK